MSEQSIKVDLRDEITVVFFANLLLLLTVKRALWVRFEWEMGRKFIQSHLDSPAGGSNDLLHRENN